MNSTIQCPRCGVPIEVSEVMSAQLRERLRAEVDAELAPQRRRLEEQSKELATKSRQLEQLRAENDERVRQMIAAERQKLALDHEALLRAEREKLATENEERLRAERERIAEQERKRAVEAQEVELRDRDEQLRAARERLRDANERELALRTEKRAVEQRQEELALEVQRRVDEEACKARETARKQADEENRLKLAEKDQQLEAMRRQIDELRRKSEQGSQQAQGEVMEVALEARLREAFPQDRFDEVPKGMRGGDLLQRVLSARGVDCGTILWETKRTRSWSDGWLPKLRQDQREARASVAILVSDALPQTVSQFELIDSVWVCSWGCAAVLAAAVRVGMIDVAEARRALEGQQGKMEQVYQYLVSPHFRNRTTGVVEALAALQSDLLAERRWIERAWAKREKQLLLAVNGIMAMYGDLQGMIGAGLPEIDAGPPQELLEPQERGLPLADEPASTAPRGRKLQR